MRIRKARFLSLLMAGAVSLLSSASAAMAQYGFEAEVPMPRPSYRHHYQPASYAEQDAPPPTPMDEPAVGSGTASSAAPVYTDYACESEPVGHACRACDRWYVALSGGAAQREQVHEVGDPATFIDFDTGFSANAALGYRFDMFRFEAEYTFINSGCSEAGAGGFSSPATGNINLKALMFNVYHDFEFDGWLWKPYVGGGLGVYQSEINSLYPEFFAGAPAPFPTTPINTTSNTPFAYQFRAGLSRPIGERTEIFGGYRYFHGETLTFASAPFATALDPTFNPNGAVVHSVELGLRIRF